MTACVNVIDWSRLPVSKEILKLHSAYNSIVLACRVNILLLSNMLVNVLLHVL